MASLQGKWSFKGYENIEGFLNAIAVPDDVKEKAIALKPDVSITQNGDNWTISTVLGDKSTDVNFKLNEPFDHQNLMGQVIKSTVTLEGERLVEKQTGGNAEITVTREVSGDELISTLSANGVTGTVRFQRV